MKLKRYNIHYNPKTPNIFCPIFQTDDGEFVRYNDIVALLESVQEVCSWDWDQILLQKYVEEELHKDLSNLNDEWDKLK